MLYYIICNCFYSLSLHLPIYLHVLLDLVVGTSTCSTLIPEYIPGSSTDGVATNSVATDAHSASIDGTTVPVSRDGVRQLLIICCRILQLYSCIAVLILREVLPVADSLKAVPRRTYQQIEYLAYEYSCTAVLLLLHVLTRSTMYITVVATGHWSSSSGGAYHHMSTIGECLQRYEQTIATATGILQHCIAMYQVGTARCGDDVVLVCTARMYSTRQDPALHRILHSSRSRTAVKCRLRHRPTF